MNDIQPQAKAPSRADTLFQIAALQTMADAIKERSDILRAQVGEQIAADYMADGTRCAVDVRLPGTTTKVGQVSTSITKEATSVRDLDTLVEWVGQEAPLELEYVTTIKDAYLKRILANIDWIKATDDEGEPVLDESGEPVYEAYFVTNKATGESVGPVPGLRRTPGDRYKNFSITGRDRASILEHLDTVGLGATLSATDHSIAALTATSGEDEEAAAAVVAGEVVDKGEESAA